MAGEKRSREGEEEGCSGGLGDLKDSSEVSKTKFGPGRVSAGVGLLLAASLGPGRWWLPPANVWSCPAEAEVLREV